MNDLYRAALKKQEAHKPNVQGTIEERVERVLVRNFSVAKNTNGLTHGEMRVRCKKFASDDQMVQALESLIAKGRVKWWETNRAIHYMIKGEA